MDIPAQPSASASGTNSIAQSFHLAWLTEQIGEPRKNFPQVITYLESIFGSIKIFDDSDLFANFIYSTNKKKIIVIASGGLGKNVVPAIHDVDQLVSIFIFCHNTAYHEQWAKVWSKVKGVFNKIDALCQAVDRFVKPPEASPIKKKEFLLKPLSDIHRAVTPAPPSSCRTDQDSGTAIDSQGQQPSHAHAHRRGRSASRKRVDLDPADSDHSLVVPMKNERKKSASPVRGDMHAVEKPSRQPSGRENEASVSKKPIVDDKREKDRRHRRTTDAPVESFNSDDSSDYSLVNSRKPTIEKMPNAQQPLPSNFKRLEHTLMQRAEQELRKSLLANNDIFKPTAPNAGTIDKLQHTLVETIEKHATKKNDDPGELNKLFGDLKQALIDSVLQQQSALLRDVIQQSVLDALKQQQPSPLSDPSLPQSSAVAEVTPHRRPAIFTPNPEIKIIANPKLTRVDATFRKQRDAVVANKRLRDAVQQWSSVSSMANLADSIKKIGANKLEYAWLLFCWICQNIQYQPYCNNNAADTVFRTKQGVCRGFASLYHECCSLLDIQCTEISGYAKQGFPKQGEDLKQSSHAWNSIVLDQYVHLIDPTWGAGGRDYDKKLEDFYFLTSPEEFIYTHYTNGYQLLEPEISKEEFLRLPVMKSTYYRLGLILLSPKEGLNRTSQNLFKIAIRAPEHVDLFAELKVGDTEYPRSFHTFCQRDQITTDVYNCCIAPPLDGLYDVVIYAKTKDETMYTDAINMRLRVSNIVDAFIFPIIYATFTEHRCILIEPLQRLVHKDEKVLIHMIIPNANVIKIRNGDDYMVPFANEYKNGVLRKEVCVQGDLQICGRWDDKADSISIICIFNMI